MQHLHRYIMSMLLNNNKSSLELYVFQFNEFNKNWSLFNFLLNIHILLEWKFHH